jgi:GMC oxidoreductase
MTCPARGRRASADAVRDRAAVPHSAPAGRARLDRCEAGLDLIRRAAATDALARLGTEIHPGPDVRTSQGLRAYIRRGVGGHYHPAGTCRIGAEGDETAVLDPGLRARGVEGLRVAAVKEIHRVRSDNRFFALDQLTLRSRSCQYGALSLNFCSFPVAVRSSAWRTSTVVGHL